ncbi:MAG: VanZ family protein [Flavobacteriales bacterium]|nr:VanZ family protein [Flavobacteriales bacterium]
MYGVFISTLLFGERFSKQNQKVKLKKGVLLCFFAIFVGAFMEILQYYIFINRSGNWYDFIANTLGVTIGALIFPLMVKFLPLKRWLNNN